MSSPALVSSDRPRIGVDARPLFFGQQTGVSRYLRNLLDAVLRQNTGLEFLLYVHRPGPNVSLPTAWRHSHLRVLSSWASCQKRLWENVALPHALRHDRVSLYFSPAYVLPLWLPCPAVVTIHDISYEVHPEWFPPLRSRYVRILSRHSARRARLVIAVSEFSKAEICRCYGISPDRVRAIHEAAEPRFFEPATEQKQQALRKQYALPEKFLAHVGSLHQRRQLPLIIAALARLHREGDFAHHLVIAGHNNFYPRMDIQDLIRQSGAEPVVHYCAFVPDDLLPALYAAADFVVYLSRYEGFGLPLLEAMASGTPVVTATTTSLAEVAGDAALLVDPESLDGICDAFRRMTGDGDLRASLIARGKSRAREFSWQDAARETVRALHDCIAV